ncbi:hypothetical protein D9M71_783330 [compost metagenome]
MLTDSLKQSLIPACRDFSFIRIDHRLQGIHRLRTPLRDPPGRLQAGDQHQQCGALIEQQRRPKGLRSKHPDKKTQHQAHCRERAETDGEQAQSSPLKNCLLKTRQPGYLRSITTLFEIDLHTTPVFRIAPRAIS